MVNIRLTPQEMIAAKDAAIARLTMERDILDAALERCAAVMTPEQLVGAGLAAPQPAEAPTLDSDLKLGGPEDNVSELLNGQAPKAAVPAGRKGG